MSLIDLITPEEKEMIDYQRRAYVDASSGAQFCSVDYLLGPWQGAKSQFLSKLFGDKLILKKPISVAESIEYIEEQMSEKFTSYNDYGLSKEKKTITKIEKAITTLFMEHRCSKECCLAILDSLRSPSAFAQNKFSADYEPDLGKNFRIIVDKEKNTTVTISYGMKLMKVFNKIAEAVGGIPDLDNLIIQHSQILNTSKINGNVCISIHPLDYITMSDNNCDWKSCMSWENDGEYKQGTVEMMNSDCIIVGYVEAAEPMVIGTHKWNNKKFRSLYFCNDKLITNIKGYPYQYPEINRIIVDWLKELCEEKYHINWGNHESFSCSNPKHDICLTTDIMYNDCRFEYSSVPDTTHMGYVNADYHDTYIDEHYSGANQCMVCGCTDVIDEGSPEALSCTSCSDTDYCYCCGHSLDIHELLEFNGQYYCEDCYNFALYNWKRRFKR